LGSGVNKGRTGPGWRSRAAIGVLGAVTAAAACAEPRAPTFAKDIAPILYGHCVSCHRPGEIGAAQSLLTYPGAKQWAKAIKDQVVSRQMPPWPADPQHSLKFRNDVRLDQKDIDTVVAWVDAGAPRGSDADLPPPPVATQQWLYPGGRKPDAVLKLPEVRLAANGEIPYVQQRVKVPLPQDKWIVAMQLQPGNNAVVHHMGITEVTLTDGVSPDDLDALAKVARQMGLPEDALTNIHPAVMDEQSPGVYDMLGVYTPGTTFEMYGDDSAKLLKSGSNLYINFNIHYTTIGVPVTNHSELALWFQAAPPKHQLFRAPAAVSTIIANGRQLLTDDPGTKAEGTDVAIPPIPPYAANYELIGMTAYTEPMTIFQLQPHAHMRGKDFKYAVVYPDGHEVTVLTVPKYDFHWQLAYDLETPLEVPAGGKLVVTAHYDNSRKNKHLRDAGVDPKTCGPDKDAYFRRQNQSWHEMFSPLIQYSEDGGRAAPAGAAKLKLVEAVGCLVRSESQAWMLHRASSPVVTTGQSTSAAELRQSATIPLGSQTYRLLGVDEFGPQRAGAHKVAVKGVLIKDANDSRLNVTSLQTVAGACS
jgi:mono/diheme cytochrome c family protein